MQRNNTFAIRHSGCLGDRFGASLEYDSPQSKILFSKAIFSLVQLLVAL